MDGVNNSRNTLGGVIISFVRYCYLNKRHKTLVLTKSDHVTTALKAGCNTNFKNS